MSTPREEGPAAVPVPAPDAVSAPREARDVAYWAAPVRQLVAATDAARRRGLDGKRLMGPEQGFGCMWQRTYRRPLAGVTLPPSQVVNVWKARFGEFWPGGAHFHPSLAGIAPGELAALDGGMGQIVVLSTGVFVMYVDETSFAYMTPQGHPFAGFITFSADDESGATSAQVSLLLRTADPLIELGYVLGVARIEDRIWTGTLNRLAGALGAGPAPVDRKVHCIDRRRQWRHWRNIRYNAAPRALLHGFRAPRG